MLYTNAQILFKPSSETMKMYFQFQNRFWLKTKCIFKFYVGLCKCSYIADENIKENTYKMAKRLMRKYK